MVLIPLSAVSAVDFSISVHAGIEPGPLSTVVLSGGADMRMIGGRGVFGSAVSVDYLPSNPKNYHATPGDLFLISSYALVQASILYGDLTFYLGPGTSIYVMPGTGIFSTLGEDGILHARAGAAYNLYPLQLFLEAEIDIAPATITFDFANPRVKVGVGILQ